MKHTCASTEALTRKVTKAQISANFILNEQKSTSLTKYYALDDRAASLDRMIQQRTVNCTIYHLFSLGTLE